MLKEIWEFHLDICDEQTILIPKNAKILSVQAQNDNLCLWVLCDPLASKIERIFYIYGTGNPIQNYPLGKFINTAQTKDGMSWHIFEKPF